MGEHECPTCGKTYGSRSWVSRHHADDHGETLLEYEKKHCDGDHPCPSCPRSFDTRQGLGQHLRNKHDITLVEYEREGGDHECPWTGCEYTANSERGISVHHSKSHGESIAGVAKECHYCGKTRRVKRHRADGSRFCSNACKFKYWRENPEKTPTRKSKESVSNEEHECPMCDQVFDTERGLSLHESRGHNHRHQDPAVLAELLVERGLSASEAAEELGVTDVTIRKWRSNLNVGGNHDCPRCGEAFDTRQGLGQHLSSIHETTLKKFEREGGDHDCPSCDFTFKNRLALGTHHGKAHGESLKEYERRTGVNGSKYECPACSGKYKSRLGLSTHYGKSHNDDGPLKELMIDELIQFANELGRTPKSEDLSSTETDIWTQGAYHNRFGSLQEALKRAGLAERGRYRNISKEDFRTEMRRVYGELDRAPFCSDMDAIGKYSYNSFIFEFGSWSTACEAAGVPAPDLYGSNNPMWRGGKSISDAVRKCVGHEPWEVTAARIRSRDGHICQWCGKEALDRKLDGHHIIPIMSGGCNADPLLQTLCISCHRTIETYIRRLFDPILVDWQEEELPKGRLPSEDHLSRYMERPSRQAKLEEFSG